MYSSVVEEHLTGNQKVVGSSRGSPKPRLGGWSGGGAPSNILAAKPPRGNYSKLI